MNTLRPTVASGSLLPLFGMAAAMVAALFPVPSAVAQLSGISTHDGGVWEYRFVEAEDRTFSERLMRDSDRELLYAGEGRIITGQYLTAGESRSRTEVSVYDAGDLRLLYRVTVPNYVQRAEWSATRDQVFLTTIGDLSTRPWIIRPDDVIPALVLVDPTTRTIERHEISTSVNLGVTTWRGNTIYLEVESGAGNSAAAPRFRSPPFSDTVVTTRVVSSGIVKGARDVRDSAGLNYLGLNDFPIGWWEAATTGPSASTAVLAEGEHAGTHLVFSTPKGAVVDVNLSTLKSRIFRLGNQFVRKPGIFDDGTIRGLYGDEIILRSDAREIRKSLAPFAKGSIDAAFREGLEVDFAKSFALVFPKSGPTEVQLVAISPAGTEERKNTIRFPQMVSVPKLQPWHETIGLVTGNVDEAQHWREIEPFTGRQIGRPVPVFEGGDSFVEQSIGLAPDGWGIVSGTTDADGKIGYGLTLANERESRSIYLGHKSGSVRGLHPLVMDSKAGQNERAFVLSSGSSQAELLSVDLRSATAEQIFLWNWNHKDGNPLYSERERWFFLPIPSGVSVFELFGTVPAVKVFDVYFQGEGDYAIVLPSGKYAGSPGCESFLSLRDRTGALVPAAILAPWRNRPADVLRVLGGSEKDIAALAATTDRWLERLGIDPIRPEPSATELPFVSVETRPRLFQPSREVRFPVAVKAGSEAVASVLVRVNGVAVEELLPSGEDLAAGREHRLEARFRLSNGQNWIEVTATDASGRGGGAERFRVIHEATGARPRRFVAVLGVSHYESLGDLPYSAIDAKSASALLGGDDPELMKRLILLDDEVDRSSLARLRTFLAQAGEDDEICLFLAGHGDLDEQLEFNFIPGKDDHRPLSETGITLSDLLEAMNASKSRKRLLLLDSCHSGILGERKERELAGERIPTGGGTDFRPLEELFRLPGLIRGVTVLAASRGSEAAWEHPDVGGGFFTATMREALGEQRADLDKNGRILVSETRDYINKRLPELSHEMKTPSLQVPSVVAFEADQDFALRGFSNAAPLSASPPAPPAMPPVAPLVGAKWVIACEAESIESQARRAAGRWRSRGFPSDVLWIPDYSSLSGAKLWLVYVGPFNERESGRPVLRKVKAVFKGAYGIKVDQSGKRETF